MRLIDEIIFNRWSGSTRKSSENTSGEDLPQYAKLSAPHQGTDRGNP